MITRRSIGWLVALASTVVLVVNCGGTVTIRDGDDDDDSSCGPLGCGSACEQLCDAQQQQGCGSPGCKEQCASMEQLIADAGCISAWNDALDCAQDHIHHMCEYGVEWCSDEAIELGECVNAYCTANPAAPGCGYEG